MSLVVCVSQCVCPLSVCVCLSVCVDIDESICRERMETEIWRMDL